MPKVSFLGVVGFGLFVPDSGSGSVTILTAMVNLVDTHFSVVAVTVTVA